MLGSRSLRLTRLHWIDQRLLCLVGMSVLCRENLVAVVDWRHVEGTFPHLYELSRKTKTSD
jgi:hypothetical protein